MSRSSFYLRSGLSVDRRMSRATLEAGERSVSLSQGSDYGAVESIREQQEEEEEG